MYIIYQIFNVDELSKLWYSENRNKYSKNYQILCGISALMMCTRKKKIEEELEHIPLEEEIKKEIERIVEEMNYDDAIPERIYDPVEEERRIREGEISRAKRLGKKEGKKEGKEEGIKEGTVSEKKTIAKSMLKDNIPIEQISKYTGLSINEITAL